MSALRIVFAGTPDFAVPSLKALIDSSFNVVAVYTQPDRPAGRGRKLMQSPVKVCANAHGIEVKQPLGLKGEFEQAALSALTPDVMVVAAYGLLLPEAVLAIPRLGCINIHASLLPAYRGASPIQQALLNGDSQTGITLMQMDKGLDTGAMLARIPCDITANETAQSLHDKLSILGNRALLTVIEALDSGNMQPTKQDDSLASHAPKISKSDGVIDWHHSAQIIERQVRAFNPWPVAHTALGQNTLRIWQARATSQMSVATPGTIEAVTAEGIFIAAGDNSLLQVSELQLSGSKKMHVKDCLNSKAHLLAQGVRLGQ